MHRKQSVDRCTNHNEPEGERNLSTLLTAMAPRLHEETFVFCTVKRGERPPSIHQALMHFREAEGETWILTQDDADTRHLSYHGIWRMITLTVHSSLEAVGFLATLLPILTKAGISTNIVSAFYHDHLFVPASRAQDALSILQSFALQHADGIG